MIASVASLFVYPVKSCRGIAVESAIVTQRGLLHDREWMIVDDAGQFITQRELPRLALIAPAVTRSSLELRAPRMAPLEIPLDLCDAPARATVWRDTLAVCDQGEEPAAWLSAYLGVAARLVRFDQETLRYCDPAHAGDSGAHTGFADAYPLLVLSAASLDDLNRRLEQPLPIDRFRPNVVLAGIEAYDEDYVTEIECGPVRMKLVKACTRCRITTTDQSTAAVGVEPLATLARYRHNPALDGVTFGMNGIVTAGFGGTLALGSPLHCTLSY
jgi:uncharacterized protein YcbX